MKELAVAEEPGAAEGPDMEEEPDIAEEIDKIEEVETTDDPTVMKELDERTGLETAVTELKTSGKVDRLTELRELEGELLVVLEALGETDIVSGETPLDEMEVSDWMDALEKAEMLDEGPTVEVGKATVVLDAEPMVDEVTMATVDVTLFCSVLLNKTDVEMVREPLYEELNAMTVEGVSILELDAGAVLDVWGTVELTTVDDPMVERVSCKLGERVVAVGVETTDWKLLDVVPSIEDELDCMLLDENPIADDEVN